MPKPRPLSHERARASLAHRFSRRADHLRQIAVDKGLRPYRAFLVWTTWDGGERGRGTESLVAQIEILPTPRVKSLDSVAYQFFSGGVLPVGSIRVDRISALFTQDQLVGLAMPESCEAARKLTPPEIESARKLRRPSVETLPEPFDFFWEIAEDGRGDYPAEKNRFRIAAWPWRDPGGLQWQVVLERISNDENRDGSLNSGFDPVDR